MDGDVWWKKRNAHDSWKVIDIFLFLSICVPFVAYLRKSKWRAYNTFVFMSCIHFIIVCSLSLSLCPSVSFAIELNGVCVSFYKQKVVAKDECPKILPTTATKSACLFICDAGFHTFCTVRLVRWRGLIDDRKEFTYRIGSTCATKAVNGNQVRSPRGPNRFSFFFSVWTPQSLV